MLYCFLTVQTFIKCRSEYAMDDWCATCVYNMWTTDPRLSKDWGVSSHECGHFVGPASLPGSEGRLRAE